MENKPSADATFDPQHDLALLQRSKQAPGVTVLLDFGPRWYAAALATVVTGFSLFGESASALANIAYIGAGTGLCIAMAVHRRNHRQVSATFSKTTAIGFAVIVIISWMIVTGYRMVMNSMGYDDFVVMPAVVAWFAITAIYLAIREGSYALLARQKTLA